MDNHTTEQRGAIQQLRELTDQADDDVIISVLESVQWDVQRAAELIFENLHPTAAGPPTSTEQPQPRTPMERFEIDDSYQGLSSSSSSSSSSRTPRERTRPAPPQPRSLILTYLSFPFHILSNIFRFIFSVLRIPLPRLPFSTLNFYRPPASTSSSSRRPASTAGGQAGVVDRWVRELEEETGAVIASRVGAATGVQAGPSAGGMTSRAGRGSDGSEDSGRILPDFWRGTYEEMARVCQRDAKVGCVVLVSEEHDDVIEFKKTALTNPAFVQVLIDNEILVYGGDVRDRDAWEAAEKLQATTYPFVAFISLQPRRTTAPTSSSSAPSPVMTVISRHQGPSHPHATAPTSPEVLINHLTTQVLPRVTPFLERLRSIQRERERDRQMRAEQDRAFQDSARKDRERIEARMREDKRREEEERQRVEMERIEVERRRKEEQEWREKEEARMAWRRWVRRGVVKSEEDGGVRVAVRLPRGERVVRKFGREATVTGLYAFVDSLLIPMELRKESDPEVAPEGVAGEAGVEKVARENGGGKWWGFLLVLAYPRKEIQWQPGTTLASLDELKLGGQLVVEMLETKRVNGNGNAAKTSTGAGDESDDGYGTEESE